MAVKKQAKKPAPKKAKAKAIERCCASETDEHEADCPTYLAKKAFDDQRARHEAVGMEVCMVVVGYVSGRDPFRLLGRVSADLGEDAMPDPPLSMAEMQPVAFAAKMALAKVLAARRQAKKAKKVKKGTRAA